MHDVKEEVSFGDVHVEEKEREIEFKMMNKERIKEAIDEMKKRRVK